MRRDPEKYKWIKERYNSIEWEKPSYELVHNRIVNKKRDKEMAIVLWDKRKVRRVWDEKWKPCSKCKEYKLWSEYHKKRWSRNIVRCDSMCKTCKTIDKREYRERIWYEVVKQRAERYRYTEVWSKIWLVDYIHYDKNWNPREVIRDVVAYEYKKWYTLINKEFGLHKVVWFRSKKWNYRFYKIEEVEKKEENKADEKEYNLFS